MLEATFGDDTLIILRLGSTGSNLFSEATLVRCSTEHQMSQNSTKTSTMEFFSANLQPFVLKTFLKLTPPGLSFFEFFEAFLEKLLNGVETIAPEENCLPDNWPSDECLEDNRPRTMSPWPIAPKENCLSDCLLPA